VKNRKGAIEMAKESIPLHTLADVVRKSVDAALRSQPGEPGGGVLVGYTEPGNIDPVLAAEKAAVIAAKVSKALEGEPGIHISVIENTVSVTPKAEKETDIVHIIIGLVLGASRQIE
jgi:hypothetical protein